MIQHATLQRNDTLTAKDRLRDAAKEATLSRVVRQHPWGSVIAVSAGSLALTGLLGAMSRTQHKGGGGVFGGLTALLTTAGGLLGPLSTIGMQAYQSYMAQAGQQGNGQADAHQSHQ